MAGGLASGIRDEIGRLLAPLVAAGSTPDGIAMLLAAIGHAGAAGRDPAVRAEVDRVVQLAIRLAELPDEELQSWDSVARVIALADDVMSGLRDIDAALPAAAQGAGQELIEHLVALHLRTHHPHVFRGAVALTLIRAAEGSDPEPLVADDSGAVSRMPWTRDRLRLDRLSALIDDAPGVLDAVYLPGGMSRAEDAHEGANLLFPSLGYLAASLGLVWFADLQRVTPLPLPPEEDDEDEMEDPEFPGDSTNQPPDTDPIDLSVFYRDFRPRLAIYLPRQESGVPVQSRFALSIAASSGQHPDGARGYVVAPLGEVGWSELRGDWRVRMTAGGLVPAFVVGPDGLASGDGSRISAAVVVERVADQAFIIGAPGSTRLEIGALAFSAAVEASPDRRALVLTGSARSAVVVLTAEDGLLRAFLPDGGVRVPFDLGIALSSDRGLEFTGGVGLARTVAARLVLGPVRVEELTIVIETHGGAVTLRTTGAIGLSIGPVKVTVNGVGMALAVSFPPAGGNLGVLDLNAAFTPPTGASMAVLAGPVSGGGSVRYDEEAGRYSGALALRFLKVSVRGVGVIDTKLPGGRRGFSLLVLLSARFPGIQLGFGVVLTGVGGLIGVNRRIDVDALRERYASGTAARLLASEDLLSDLPAVLTELSAVFPPAEGVHVVGPTLQLQWAKVVTLDVGVFLEFPGPTRVVILGTARASVNNPLAAGPLLRLRCDFVGDVDLARRTLAFDAVLVDSMLLEEFPVTGGLMVRAAWGDDPYVVFSAGGFNPDFAPGALVLPKTLTRLALSSGSSNILRFEGYFAITPNTVQFGASVEVTAKLGPMRVRGFVGFHALIRLDPFAFSIPFDVKMEVQWRGRTLAGINVSGTLSGPGPVRFTGRACIELLFFDLCRSGSFELGSDAPPRVGPVPDVLDVLGAELRNPANLRTLAEDPSVVLRQLPASALPILTPGGLAWEQTRAPLGLLLERFEGSSLSGPVTVEVAGDAVTGAEREWFAPGSFAELSKSEALTRRSFERLRSGIRLADRPDDRSIGREHEVKVREFRLPSPVDGPRMLDRLEAPDWLLEAAQVRENLAGGRRRAPLITVSAEEWQVLGSDGQELAATDESQAHQIARRLSGAVALPAHDLITVDL
jgi:hypothetical protein